MNHDPRSSTVPHLIWVYSGFLSDALSAADHLDTTHELRKLGWRVTLVAAGPAGLQRIRGVEVLCIPMLKLYFIGILLFHIRVIRFIMLCQTASEIIFFHQTSAPWLLPLRFVRHLMGRRRTFLVMDTRSVHMPPRDKEGWKGRVRRVFLKLMNRLANRWADGQTAITLRMAKAVNIPSQQLWGIWPSGVNLERFSPAQTARRWPSTAEPIRLVYIGTLDYERNLMKLCRAVEQANAEGLVFNLILVGNGMERAELAEFAKQTKGRIRVLPPIPHEQVPELLAQAHVGVLPFPNEEKFRVSSPIKLFEYMAAGLPILATRIVCHTDVIGDGTYAFLAENSEVEGLLDALRQTWEERASLPLRGREAAEAAHERTWAESAKKLKAALEHGLARFDEARFRLLREEQTVV